MQTLRINPQSVVIIGGGFCGALAAKRLDSVPEVDTTLIDPCPVFEYIPGIPRIPFKAGVGRKLTIPFESFLRRTEIVTARADTITPDHVEAGGEKIGYDYCIICTGVMQPVHIENRHRVYTLASVADGTAIGEALPDAGGRVLIVGGGVVGTEIAGDLATRRPDYNVTVVHSKARLLERNPPRASAYAHRFLDKSGVNMVFEDRVIDNRDGAFETESGRVINADLTVWCAGVRPDPPNMAGFSDNIFTEHMALRVENTLQLTGYPHVFVGGDLTDVREEKTAQNAERHAQHITKNLLRHIAGRSLTPYRPRTGPLVVSLGPTHGLMTYRNWTLKGYLPGFMKWGIEFMVLRQYRGAKIK